MNKRKIMALALTLSMVAILAIGGTLAYFTDTDGAENTFTVGGVKIELVERQRNENGTALEEFVNDKVLMPIVGSAQGEKTTVDGVAGLPTAKNYVDKIITVKNTGKSDAYMKVFVAIPVELDNVGDASKNILHFNMTKESDANWEKEVCEAQNVTVKGVQCNIYSRICKDIIAPDAATATPAYIGFYLDKNVDQDANGNFVINDSVIEELKDGAVTIPVFAQGIQAAGFTSATEAFAQSGLPTNPWAE